ncbi:MAG: threonine/serine dehydratase, partial [Asgard group archaeon]|nr:threonine/serine dehydratase [Asgard group archaeon]
MFQQVKDAYDRIADHVNHTPVMTSSTLNNRFSSRFYFKCENFQKIGAFKFRGALNAVAQLSLEEKKRGVITHSSGNHAQALALAGKILDVKTVIVMPENAPAVKVEATKGYGAEVIMCGSKPGDREEAVKPLIKKHGYVLVHPSNDWEIIYGQGTAAFELIKEVGNLDYLLAPVGGGGLLSGTAIVAKGLLENVKVIGVEPKNADDAYKSFTRGKIHPS